MSDEQIAEEATEMAAGASANEGENPSTLPDDHPLVRTLAAQKETIKELREKSRKLDEIEEAQKSEAERAADRVKSLEAEVQAAQREALRFKVASKFGVSDEDADLFLTGSDEDTLTKQAQRLSERADQQKKSGPHVSREGVTTPPPKADEFREFTRNLFARSE